LALALVSGILTLCAPAEGLRPAAAPRPGQSLEPHA
jgi:hypothetical protein